MSNARMTRIAHGILRRGIMQAEPYFTRLRNTALAAALAALAFGHEPASAGDTHEAAQSLASNLKTLRAILELPEQDIDLAKVELTIDHMIDPSVDVVAGLKQLDAMVAEIRSFFPTYIAGGSAGKVVAIRTYLYSAGPWNRNHPYRYNFDDPFAKEDRTPLLSTYLLSHRGNCVSMSLLFIILGEKLGLNMSLVQAGNHVFVRWHDENGTDTNLETTSYAQPFKDEWYIKKLSSSPDAIDNEIYMHPLDRIKTADLMISRLQMMYFHKKQYQSVIDLGGLMYSFYPNNITSMLNVSNAAKEMVNNEFYSKYDKFEKIPLNLREHFQFLYMEKDYWFLKAEVLGFRKQDPAEEEKYLEVVSAAKKREQEKME